MKNTLDRFEKMTWRYFDQRLSPGEEEQLKKALHHDQGLCTRFSEIAILHSALDRVVNLEPCQKQNMAQARWRTAARRVAAAAALMLAAVGLVLLVTSQTAKSPWLAMTLDNPTGIVVVERRGTEHEAQAGMRLQAGDSIRTAANATVNLKHAEANAVATMAPDTAVRLSAQPGPITLTHGVLKVSVPHSPHQPWTFETDRARVSVIGTQFELAAAQPVARVAVTKGMVSMMDRVRDIAVHVPAGQGAVVSPWAPPTAFSMGASDGLLALYLFNEGQGTTVYDVSGIGDPLNLVIGNPEKTEWRDGGLRLLGAADITFEKVPVKIHQALKNRQGLTIDAFKRVHYVGENSRALFMAVRLGRYRQTWTTWTRKLDQDTQETATHLHSAFVLQQKDGQVDNHFYNNGQFGSTSPLGRMNLAQTPPSHISFAPVPESLDSASSNVPWQGTLHKLALYGRALTPEEILENAADVQCECPACQRDNAANRR